MHDRDPPAISVLFACTLLACTLSACAGPHPFVREGDEKSVQVAYSGDVASAWPLARRHCAAYERVPRLTDTSLDTAYFDCVPQ
ncbi:MAG TPA: hypothetical protein VJR70_04945 [Stellaceae bacterium]|nr:hypothetical protein [Stellaceae bacterium]